MAGTHFQLSTANNPLAQASSQYSVSPANSGASGNAPGAHSPVGGTSYGAGGSGSGIPRLGPTKKGNAGAVVENRWLGLNRAVAPERLTGLESPDLVNFTTWQRAGSLSSRMCRGKCAETPSESTGVCALPTSFIGSDGNRRVVLVSWNGSNAQTLEVSKLSLPAKPERRLDFVPAVTLTSPSSGNIRVAISSLSTVGGIESVLCCWSAEGYPTSPWAIDSRRLTAGREETAWFGDTSYSQDTDVSAIVDSGEIVYITVWIVGRMGFSEAWRGTIEVA